jgi:hypothetical protein
VRRRARRVQWCMESRLSLPEVSRSSPGGLPLAPALQGNAYCVCTGSLALLAGAERADGGYPTGIDPSLTTLVPPASSWLGSGFGTGRASTHWTGMSISSASRSTHCRAASTDGNRRLAGALFGTSVLRKAASTPLSPRSSSHAIRPPPLIGIPTLFLAGRCPFVTGPARQRGCKRKVARHTGRPQAANMFTVSATEAAAIRTAFEEKGELSAALELRRLFPGVTDNVKARAFARTIAGWSPRPMPACTVTRLHPHGST